MSGPFFDQPPDHRADAPDLSSAHLTVPTHRHPGEGKSRPPLLMLIDDSPAIRTIVEHTFARVGVQVASFPDGIAAIAALAEGRAVVPDLVLLDIDLPRLDGYQVAAVLRTNVAFAEVPIVMLSGRNGLIDRARSKMVGARTFVSKPFRPRELVAVVGEQLGITLA
jgi:twitching motility two-component system response regulator PilG